MQLRRSVPWLTVGLALCAASFAAADEGAGKWILSFDALGSTDTDSVMVLTPQVSLRRTLDEDGSEVRARVGVDVVSAASVDVVAQATRGFFETREEVSLGGTYAVGGVKSSLDYRFSIEPDYVSNGLHLGLTTDLRSPDTVLALGYGATYDLVGLRSTPFAVWSRDLWSHQAELSLTQTLGENTLLRVIYSLTIQHGYLEKPYRYVPLFSAAGIERARADGVELGLDNFDDYRLPERVPEYLPNIRVGHAVGLRLVQHIAALGASLRVDLQGYLDSWGLAALVTQPTITFQLGDEFSLALFGRYYLQSAASFWQRTYVVSSEAALPAWRTLNRELSPYSITTGGTRLEWRREPLMLYLDLSIAYASFSDFLFLDHRTNLMGLVGLRWTL